MPDDPKDAPEFIKITFDIEVEKILDMVDAGVLPDGIDAIVNTEMRTFAAGIRESMMKIVNAYHLGQIRRRVK
jgi:hypothetical protein